MGSRCSVAGGFGFDGINCSGAFSGTSGSLSPRGGLRSQSRKSMANFHGPWLILKHA